MTKLPVIVAIPARNEADRVGACLMALARQPAAHDRIASVVLYANNCNDATATLARGLTLPFPLHVIEAELIPANAHIGHARHSASEAAIASLHRLGHADGIISGTDADSSVAPGWLAALIAAFAPNVDAVCGAIDTAEPLAAGLMAARAAEAAYADAVARATALLDPLPHDPWPNHIWSWGANFAVRAAVLTAVGGTPQVALAEDRALHAALLAGDFRIRHSRAVRVQTSARADGRAPGGFADLLASYADNPAALADFALEPPAIAWRRALLRGVARRQWGARPGFGAFWNAYEASRAGLARRRVAVSDLAAAAAALDSRIKAAARRSGIWADESAASRAPRAASRQ